jgi:hypothetical protein
LQAILLINAYLIISQLQDGIPDNWYIYMILAILLTAYVCFVARLGIGQFFSRFQRSRASRQQEETDATEKTALLKSSSKDRALEDF